MSLIKQQQLPDGRTLRVEIVGEATEVEKQYLIGLLAFSSLFFTKLPEEYKKAMLMSMDDIIRRLVQILKGLG